MAAFTMLNEERLWGEDLKEFWCTVIYWRPLVTTDNTWQQKKRGIRRKKQAPALERLPRDRIFGHFKFNLQQWQCVSVRPRWTGLEWKSIIFPFRHSLSPCKFPNNSSSFLSISRRQTLPIWTWKCQTSSQSHRDRPCVNTLPFPDVPLPFSDSHTSSHYKRITRAT